MRKIMTLAFALLFAFSLVAVSNSTATEQAEQAVAAVDWNAFSKNLKQALQSKNDGLRQSAMRHIILYGDKVNVGDGMLEILRTYRSDDDLQARRLALAALPKTGSRLAIGFLRNAVKFEKSEVLKRQIQFILAEDAATRN